MNVRITPSVRCSYDASENVLRILTQESIAEAAPNRDDGKNATGVVVYAMKVQLYSHNLPGNHVLTNSLAWSLVLKTGF